MSIDTQELEEKTFFYKCAIPAILTDDNKDDAIGFAKITNVRYNANNAKICTIRFCAPDFKEVNELAGALLENCFHSLKAEIILNKATQAKLLLMGL